MNDIQQNGSRAVLEVKLSQFRRWIAITGGLLTIVLTVFVTWRVIGKSEFLPVSFRVVGPIVLIGMLTTGLLFVWIGVRGVYHRRRHGELGVAGAMLVGGAMGLALVHAGWSGGDHQMVFGGTVMLAIIAGGVVLAVMEQFHLANRQKLLDIELRVAELSDKLDRLAGHRVQ